jgi:hypothetical protein
MNKLYYFYSEQSEKSLKYLDIVEDIGGETVCVDSMKIRKRLKKIGIEQIPCIVFKEDKRILQNQQAIDFLRQFIQPPQIRHEHDKKSLPNPIQIPGRTPISQIPIITRTAEEQEINDTVKKAVKENSIMDKVKVLTKEREEVLIDNKN